MPALVVSGSLNTTPGSLVLVRDPRLARPWRISDEGQKLIISFEKLATKIYLDQAGYPTIGIGHLITKQELESGVFNNGITEEQARQMFDKHLGYYVSIVNKNVRVPLHQYEIDALVCLAYNIPYAMRVDSDLVKLLNGGYYEKVSGEILKWNKVTQKDSRGNKVKVVSNGLSARRRAEAILFDRGVYEYHN